MKSFFASLVLLAIAVSCTSHKHDAVVSESQPQTEEVPLEGTIITRVVEEPGRNLDAESIEEPPCLSGPIERDRIAFVSNILQELRNNSRRPPTVEVQELVHTPGVYKVSITFQWTEAGTTQSTSYRVESIGGEGNGGGFVITQRSLTEGPHDNVITIVDRGMTGCVNQGFSGTAPPMRWHSLPEDSTDENTNMHALYQRSYVAAFEVVEEAMQGLNTALQPLNEVY